MQQALPGNKEIRRLTSHKKPKTKQNKTKICGDRSNQEEKSHIWRTRINHLLLNKVTSCTVVLS
jgi:hypothetical protein